MAYMTYRGLADEVFTHGESECRVSGLEVAFDQTHTAVFRIGFLTDRPERIACTAVHVTLANGWVEYGPVTYIPAFGLVFFTGDEWGTPRDQPSARENISLPGKVIK